MNRKAPSIAFQAMRDVADTLSAATRLQRRTSENLTHDETDEMNAAIADLVKAERVVRRLHNAAQERSGSSTITTALDALVRDATLELVHRVQAGDSFDIAFRGVQAEREYCVIGPHAWQRVVTDARARLSR